MAAKVNFKRVDSKARNALTKISRLIRSKERRVLLRSYPAYATFVSDAKRILRRVATASNVNATEQRILAQQCAFYIRGLRTGVRLMAGQPPIRDLPTDGAVPGEPGGVAGPQRAKCLNKCDQDLYWCNQDPACKKTQQGDPTTIGDCLIALEACYYVYAKCVANCHKRY